MSIPFAPLLLGDYGGFFVAELLIHDTRSEAKQTYTIFRLGVETGTSEKKQ